MWTVYQLASDNHLSNLSFGFSREPIHLKMLSFGAGCSRWFFCWERWVPGTSDSHLTFLCMVFSPLNQGFSISEAQGINPSAPPRGLHLDWGVKRTFLPGESPSSWQTWLRKCPANHRGSKSISGTVAGNTEPGAREPVCERTPLRAPRWRMHALRSTAQVVSLTLSLPGW